MCIIIVRFATNVLHCLARMLKAKICITQIANHGAFFRSCQPFVNFCHHWCIVPLFLLFSFVCEGNMASDWTLCTANSHLPLHFIPLCAASMSGSDLQSNAPIKLHMANLCYYHYYTSGVARLCIWVLQFNPPLCILYSPVCAIKWFFMGHYLGPRGLNVSVRRYLRFVFGSTRMETRKGSRTVL